MKRRRAALVAVAVIALTCCGGDDDDESASTDSVVGPAPSEDVTAGAYAEQYNVLSESLQVGAIDNDAPSTEPDNWQLRLDIAEPDVDEGWALMQDFAGYFGCDLPNRQPRDDTLVVDC
jgi:hypothetical protein